MFFTEDFQKHQPCRMIDGIPSPGKILALTVLAWPGKVWQRHLGFFYRLYKTTCLTQRHRPTVGVV